MEVRDQAPGICGWYRLSWHHTHVCEESYHEYWGDTLDSKTMCVVSREAIRKCNEELCKERASAESTGSGVEDESDRHIGPIVALVSFSLICGCVCLRRCAKSQEVDEEKVMDAATPVGPSRDLWDLTPKSMNSSPIAKWIDKTRRAAVSSSSNKIVVQPEPSAAASATRNRDTKLQIVDSYRLSKERKHVQPASWRGCLNTSIPGDLTRCPPGMIETQGFALRQAALVHATPLRPPPLPQTVCPPPQLPTLLQRPTPGSYRKKPPLRGVPPQEPTLVPSRKGPTKNVTWDQALGPA
jgi:hypothetical protein